MRRRDIWVIGLGFVAVLATLCLSGELGWRAGALAGLVFMGAVAVYSRTMRDEPELATPVEPTDKRVGSPDAGPQAQRAVVTALSQPALIVRGRQINAFNDAARTLFSFAENSKPPLASLRHPFLLAGIDDVRASRTSYTCEIVPARHPEQSWSAHITALADGQDEPDVLIVLTDLAPVRRAERARADFLANASHELRTPLTSISGFVETMQGAAKDDKDAWPRFIDIIAEQASHMRELISDLLSLSRIELGEHQLPDTIIDLQQTLSESIEAMAHAAMRRGVKINFELSEREGAKTDLGLLGSESEVKQVVQNLIGNALKYSPLGAQISVQAGRIAQGDAQHMACTWVGASRVTLFSSAAGLGDNGGVWFSVRDQGVGIEPEFLPRLGERFFRVDDSRGGPVEGTGLGLAIVKHIMAHHQGGLVVESLVGQGAQFTVWFKAARRQG